MSTFLHYIQQQISRKSLLHKPGTAQNYQAALNSFQQFLQPHTLTPQDLTPELIERYQAWLAARGIANNSISFYMRILRCIYNHAVKHGLTTDRKPFQDVYTGIDKTRKRAIPLADIKRIQNLDLSPSPPLQRARDLFMLSFYCMGISFIDLATLKKTNIADGRLTYKRSKTRQTITMALNPKMSAMFHKYAATPDSPFLLNIIRDPDGDIRRQYQNQLSLTNRYLKKIATIAGLNVSLTTYVSRHSWASTAHNMNVNISIISDALGHDNETTTQIYLASLDTGHIDQANELILSGL